MRVLFSDDHALIRESVGFFLKQLSDDVEVIEAGDFSEALTKASSGPSPDLIILDLFMPGMHHLKGLSIMREKFPDVPIVILTGNADQGDAFAALETGADGYIPKTIGAKTMLNALRLVLSGEKYLPSLLVGGTSHSTSPGAGSLRISAGRNFPLKKLTRREREVLSYLTEGFPNKEIARQLDLQEVTIKVHLKGIYRKLGVNNRTQAVRIALDHNRMRIFNGGSMSETTL